MPVENLIVLLIVVLLPLVEWIGRLMKEREAERRRRVDAPRDATPVNSSRVPQMPPVRVPAPPRQPAPPGPRRPPAVVTPSSAASVHVPLPVPPDPVPVRRPRVTFRGSAALRRAVIERTVLGPCRAAEPYGFRFDG